MTPYRFRLVSASGIFLLLAFAVFSFGAVELWAITVFELGVFALAAVWAIRIGIGSVQPARNPFCPPLGLLFVWIAAQYGLGVSVYPYRTAAEALKWLAFWLLFAVAAQVFIDQSIRRAFSLAMVWFSFGLCVFGLIQNFTSQGLMYWSIAVPAGKIFGPFVNANHFVAWTELIVPAALLLALRKPEQRLIYVAVCGMILTAVVVCGSRAGLILVASQILIVLASKAVAERASRRATVWLVLCAVAAPSILGITILRTQSLSDRFQEQQPYRVRWMVARATWRLFVARPWTGYGAGTFDQVYPSTGRDLGLHWAHAHNDPVQFAMEWGFAGLGVLAWILWLLLSRRWPLDVWLKVVLPVLTVLVHSWFDFPLQIPAVTAAWLVTLALLDPAGRRLPIARPTREDTSRHERAKEYEAAALGGSR